MLTTSSLSSSSPSLRLFCSLATWRTRSTLLLPSVSPLLHGPRLDSFNPNHIHQQRSFINTIHNTQKNQRRRTYSVAQQHQQLQHEQRNTSHPLNATTSHASSTFSSTTALPGIAMDDKMVKITWPGGIESRYHNIWLRDHCRCPNCYHPKTKQRLLNTFAIPPEIRPVAVEATIEGLEILWPIDASQQQQESTSPSSSSSSSSSSSNVTREGSDSHAAFYPWKWLRMNSYAPPLLQTHTESITYQEEIAGPGKTLWDSGIAAHPPTIGYEEVMKDDRGVWNWLEKIARYGFSFVSDVPATPEATEELIRRIAFIRETHYGGFWDFTSDLSHGDTAYTDLALGAHTDTTYFTDPAGLQLFHLLSHGPAKDGTAPSGGASLLVDGFMAAKILKDVHPEAYDILSTVRISTHSAGDENTFISPLMKGGYPILQHDVNLSSSGSSPHGKLVMVRYNNDDRSVLSLAECQVESFYSALSKWNSLLTSPSVEYWQQLVPGTCLIFDNHRVLHGRSAFVGQRRLCGGYVNGDDYRSRLEVLRKRFAGATAGGTGRGDQFVPRSVWDEGL